MTAEGRLTPERAALLGRLGAYALHARGLDEHRAGAHGVRLEIRGRGATPRARTGRDDRGRRGRAPRRVPATCSLRPDGAAVGGGASCTIAQDEERRTPGRIRRIRAPAPWLPSPKVVVMDPSVSAGVRNGTNRARGRTLWRADSTGIAHGHRRAWRRTACGRPIVLERLAWPPTSKCPECRTALELATPEAR